MEAVMLWGDFYCQFVFKYFWLVIERTFKRDKSQGAFGKFWIYEIFVGTSPCTFLVERRM